MVAPATPRSVMPPLRFLARWRYGFPFSPRKLEDFLGSERDDTEIVSRVHRYTHATVPNLNVTLVPIIHRAHPQFFHQIDALLAQHQSVLVEGRYGNAHAGFTTLTPRAEAGPTRPAGLDAADGWEPHQHDAYMQPPSWGVLGSPQNTVLHAADAYDSDALPLIARVRFNFPLVGSRKREKHCLGLIPPLYAQGYDSFAVPWGAIHMPTMHSMLIENGFLEVGQTAIVVFRREDGEISTAEVVRWSSLLWWRGFVKALAMGVGFIIITFSNMSLVLSMVTD